MTISSLKIYVYVYQDYLFYFYYLLSFKKRSFAPARHLIDENLRPVFLNFVLFKTMPFYEFVFNTTRLIAPFRFSMKLS